MHRLMPSLEAHRANQPAGEGGPVVSTSSADEAVTDDAILTAAQARKTACEYARVPHARASPLKAAAARASFYGGACTDQFWRTLSLTRFTNWRVQRTSAATPDYPTRMRVRVACTVTSPPPWPTASSNFMTV